MAQLSDVISLARTLARTDSNGLTDADGIAFANEAVLDMYQRFTERAEDFLTQDATRDITSDELDTGSSPGRFLLPNDNYKIKNLWINVQDPTSQNYWHQAELMDVSNLPPGQDWEWYKLNQPTNKPLFDYRGDWFEIAPTPRAVDITSPPLVDALRITYFILPQTFTTTADYVVYPYNMDWRMLAYRMAASFLKTYSNPLFQEMDTQYLTKVQSLIRATGSGEQVPTRAKGLGLTGWEF